jgi:hypothetical protein
MLGHAQRERSERSEGVRHRVDIGSVLADIAPPEALVVDVIAGMGARRWLRGFLVSGCSDLDWACAADCLLMLDGLSLQSDEVARLNEWLANASRWPGVGRHARFARGVLVRRAKAS